MKEVKLFFMDNAKNSYKYYNMIQTSETTFTAEYGRFGQKPRLQEYEMTEWEDLLKSKLKKGYKEKKT